MEKAELEEKVFQLEEIEKFWYKRGAPENFPKLFILGRYNYEPSLRLLQDQIRNKKSSEKYHSIVIHYFKDKWEILRAGEELCLLTYTFGKTENRMLVPKTITDKIFKLATVNKEPGPGENKGLNDSRTNYSTTEEGAEVEPSTIHVQSDAM